MVLSLVLYDELLLKYEIVCMYTHIRLSHVMCCPRNHEIVYNQNAFIFKTIFFLHLSGPIEEIYTHSKMSHVFNLGLIYPLNTSLHNSFSLIFKFS